jgi:hypothetical protein
MSAVSAGLAIAAAGLANAQAPPAVACEIADFNVVLNLYMPLGNDGSGVPAPGSMQGTLEIHHQKVPKAQRRWSLDGKSPAQFWNHNDDLRIMLLLGSGEDRVRLVIDARRQDSGDHRGTFRLEAAGVRVTGRLACAVG